MAEPAARRHLADRAAEIWKTKDVTYSQAVDEALAEQNPTEDVAVGERLLYALLNVEPAVRHARRRSPRAPDERRPDIEKRPDEPTTQSEHGDAPDGPESFDPAPEGEPVPLD